MEHDPVVGTSGESCSLKTRWLKLRNRALSPAWKTQESGLTDFIPGMRTVALQGQCPVLPTLRPSGDTLRVAGILLPP